MSGQERNDQRPEVISSPKWVRTFLGGEAVADSRRCLLLRAQGQLPVYYFPVEDVHMEWLEQAAADSSVIEQGEGPWPEPPAGATVYSVQVGDKGKATAAWQVPETAAEHPELAGRVAFAWQAMDAWFEEDWQIRVHPHDPYHLIDVRPSSRHVQIAIHGEPVAESSRPVLVFETGLPTRYYLPKMDVRMDLLVPGTRTTHCAYKGTAPHYTLALPGDEPVENIAWRYPFPNPGYEQIQNLVCFYQERIKEFYVDGEEIGDGEVF